MSKRIVVYGSYVTDLTARCEAFPTEGQTVKGSSFKDGPGGKGSNQAVAAHRAGADVLLISRIGRDHYGDEMLRFYQAEGMATDGIILSDEEATGCALIMVNEKTSQNEIVVIPAACDNFSEAEIAAAAEKFLPGADLLVTQLETNFDANQQMLKAAKALGIPTILNPAPARPLTDETLSLCDIIIPNETEASLITGMQMLPDCSNAPALAKKLMEMGAKKVIITLGAHGVYATDGEREETTAPRKAGTVVDTTGAGDAFVGGFASGIARGYDFFKAVRWGNTVSSIAVTRYGTAPAMPYEAEVEQLFEG